MKMIYFEHMAKKFPGYEITEEDIKGILWYLQTNKDKNATREDAIRFLEENADAAHIIAHKIVADEQSGKIKKIRFDKENKNNQN